MDECLRRELQEQASRNTRERTDARATSLREQEAAVAAAVAAKALQLKAVKAVDDKANAALTARLEVRALREKGTRSLIVFLRMRMVRIREHPVCPMYEICQHVVTYMGHDGGPDISDQAVQRKGSTFLCPRQCPAWTLSCVFSC